MSRVTDGPLNGRDSEEMCVLCECLAKAYTEEEALGNHMDEMVCPMPVSQPSAPNTAVPGKRNDEPMCQSARAAMASYHRVGASTTGIYLSQF